MPLEALNIQWEVISKRQTASKHATLIMFCGGTNNNVTLHLCLSHPHQVTTGTTSLTPRWDKCVNYVENSLVYATGRLFVNTHFQEDKKHMVRVCCMSVLNQR